MKLDTENDNVYMCTMKLEEARELIGTEGNTDDLDNCLDQAQGEISMQRETKTYVVIEIS